MAEQMPDLKQEGGAEGDNEDESEDMPELISGSEDEKGEDLDDADDKDGSTQARVLMCVERARDTH